MIENIHDLINAGGNSLLGGLVSRMSKFPSTDEVWNGIAPIGHRVTIDTPKLLPVTINIRCVLTHDFNEGQIKERFKEVVEQYFTELRQDVLDSWERTYFDNSGISNSYADLQNMVSSFISQINSMGLNSTEESIILEFAQKSREWFPADAAYQTHTWYTIVNPHVIGVRLLETRLISAIDFENILLNGIYDPNGLKIEQTQENQYMPVFEHLDIEIVDYIEPPAPPQPPVDTIQKVYITGFDKPVSEVTEVLP